MDMSVPCEMNHVRMLSNPLPHHTPSNRIKTRNASPKFVTQTLKMNVTTVRHSRANETSQHVLTHHVRHSFMPNDQTNPKITHFMLQFIKCKYSIPFMLQPKENSLDCCKMQSHSMYTLCTLWYLSQSSH